MKNPRQLLTGLLVAAGLCVVSGCATSGQQYTALDDGSGLQKKQASPTEDMNAAQKAGYYLGWFSLVSIYEYANGGLPLVPPPTTP